MKILVTGGAGFIGSNFIRYVLSRHTEDSIINLDKLTYAGNLENLLGLEDNSRYSFIRGDICDRGIFEDIEFDAIVNFAAESHVDRSILDAAPFLNTNVLGTHNVLEAARKKKCRLLHISTDEVYGSIGAGLFTESSPLQPNSPYAASKASSDLFVRSYFETYKLDVLITRCSNNYGPYQFPEKLMPLVIVNALERKTIPVYADGLNVRDWIFVQDHCSALDAVLRQGMAGEVYNIGGRNEQRNIDIVRTLLNLVAKKTDEESERLTKLIEYVKDRPGHDKRYAIDPSKIERTLGWSPETRFDEGLSRTVEWYLENRKWWERIISGEYQKYYDLQYKGRTAG